MTQGGLDQATLIRIGEQIATSHNILNDNIVQSHRLLSNMIVQLSKQVSDSRSRLLDVMNLLDVTEFKRRFPHFSITAERPIASTSHDHLFPRGTLNDNTRYPRLVQKCRELFGERSSLLDLGCAGGGLVSDFIFNRFPAVGLEGSDSSQLVGRAEWAIIADFLFTCDIVRPFTISSNSSGERHKFTLISAWEVLEHIPESSLPQLFMNVFNHLEDDGYFIASVAQFEDKDPLTGAEWHVTLKQEKWWHDQLKKAGLKVIDGIFHVKDFPRGSGNGPEDWDRMRTPEAGFHLAAQKLL